MRRAFDTAEVIAAWMAMPVAFAVVAPWLLHFMDWYLKAVFGQ